MSNAWLAIFCAPKPFTGAAALHQCNAIKSWQRLGEGIELLILGNERGIDEIAKELDALHVPDIKRSKSGTPLVSSLFLTATNATQAPLLCYVNADIVLLSDFPQAVRRVAFTQFLMSGRRWDVPENEALDFADVAWEKSLRHQVREVGSLHAPSAMDYFVFPRGLLDHVPDFAVGRAYWDTWLVFHARSLGVPVIDATATVTVIHPNHDYGHVLGGEEVVWKGSEARRNRELAEEMLFPFTLEDATWELTPTGMRRRIHIRKTPRMLQAEIALWLRHRPTSRRLLRTLLRAKFV